MKRSISTIFKTIAFFMIAIMLVGLFTSAFPAKKDDNSNNTPTIKDPTTQAPGGSDVPDEPEEPEVVYSEGLSFTLSEDETYYSLSGLGSCEDEVVVVPPTFNDLPIRSVTWSLFEIYTVTTVKFNSRIDYICDEAFLGSIVREIYFVDSIPEGYQWGQSDYITILVYVDGLYYGTPNIRYSLSDDGTYYIVTSVFDMDRVYIPDSYAGLPVREIGPAIGSFSYISIPSSVTAISDTAFSGCYDAVIDCAFAEGTISGAPWGCNSDIDGAKVNYIVTRSFKYE